MSSRPQPPGSRAARPLASSALRPRPQGRGRPDGARGGLLDVRERGQVPGTGEGEEIADGRDGNSGAHRDQRAEIPPRAARSCPGWPAVMTATSPVMHDLGSLSGLDELAIGVPGYTLEIRQEIYCKKAKIAEI